MGENSPFLNGREIEALALVSDWMEHEDEDEHKPYQPEFAWLADLVDGSALDKIVQGGKAFDLAGVLLRGVPFDGLERIAAHELLKACACYNDVLYADKEQYCNLAQAHQIGVQKIARLLAEPARCGYERHDYGQRFSGSWRVGRCHEQVRKAFVGKVAVPGGRGGPADLRPL